MDETQQILKELRNLSERLTTLIQEKTDQDEDWEGTTEEEMLSEGLGNITQAISDIEEA